MQAPPPTPSRKCAAGAKCARGGRAPARGGGARRRRRRRRAFDADPPTRGPRTHVRIPRRRVSPTHLHWRWLWRKKADRGRDDRVRGQQRRAAGGGGGARGEGGGGGAGGGDVGAGRRRRVRRRLRRSTRPRDAWSAGSTKKNAFKQRLRGVRGAQEAARAQEEGKERRERGMPPRGGGGCARERVGPDVTERPRLRRARDGRRPRASRRALREIRKHVLKFAHARCRSRAGRRWAGEGGRLREAGARFRETNLGGRGGGEGGDAGTS